jgi:hypothetical protein
LPGRVVQTPAMRGEYLLAAFEPQAGQRLL